MTDEPARSNVKADVERRLEFAGIGPEDIKNLTRASPAVLDHVDEHVGAFFDYLGPLPEARELFRRRELLDEARRLKRLHLQAMVGGAYGQSYVEERLELGKLYYRCALAVSVFLGAYGALMRSIARRVFETLPTEAGHNCHLSFDKLGYFDISIIVDSMIEDRERTILQQQAAIRDLSTPALKLRERLLLLPIIGLLDSARAKQLTEGLLHAIRAHRAKIVVMDVTGVPAIDTKVANHLILTVAAAKLMGAGVIVTGLSADVAQSLVMLGIDVRTLNTVGDLQGGIEEAERMLGYHLELADERSPRG